MRAPLISRMPVKLATATSRIREVTVFDGLDLGWTYTSTLAVDVTHDLSVVSKTSKGVLEEDIGDADVGWLHRCHHARQGNRWRCRHGSQSGDLLCPFGLPRGRRG